MAAVTSAGRASGLEPLELALDSHAEEILYQRNAGRIFGYCLSRLRRREDAEDAVQTTFLYAVRSLRRGVVPLVESAWLLGIARNVCLERWEAAGRRSRVETAWDPLDLDQGHPAPQESRDDLIGLEDALSRLPEQQRRAILLRDWRGLSYVEVADHLGVSQAAVETLIFRGRRALAEQLREEAQATPRRRLGSLANVGSLFTAVKGALTGAAAGIKIAAAITAVAVSGAGLAVGSSSLRDRSSEPPRAQPQRVEPHSPTPAPAVASPPRRVVVAPTSRQPEPRMPLSQPSRKPVVRVAPPAVATPAPVGAAAQPAPTIEKSAPAEKSVVEKVGSSVPPAVKEPVEKVVDAVVTPVVAPVEETVDTVVGTVAPAVPQAVDTLVESLPTVPVEPVATAVTELAEPLTGTAPLLP